MSSNPRRAELSALSKALKPLVKAGKFTNTNAAVMAYYQDKTNQTDFRTFASWKKSGFVVRKGESGFPIWATPRNMAPREGARMSDLAQVAAMQGAEVQGPEWFPVCYLFHVGQVEQGRAAGIEKAIGDKFDHDGAMRDSGHLVVSFVEAA